MPPSHGFLAATAQTTGSANPFTHSVTVRMGDTVLVVPIVVVGATSRTGGAPTYAGRTLTQAGTEQKAAASPEVGVELWYLINPPAGTANVSVPNAGSLTLFVNAITLSCSTGASKFHAASGANGTSIDPSATIETTEDGCAIVSILAGGHTNITTGTPALTQIWETDHGAFGSSGQYTMQSSAGSQATNWTNATSDDWAICNVAFAPAKGPVSFGNYHRIDPDTVRRPDRMGHV